MIRSEVRIFASLIAAVLAAVAGFALAGGARGIGVGLAAGAGLGGLGGLWVLRGLRGERKAVVRWARALEEAAEAEDVPSQMAGWDAALAPAVAGLRRRLDERTTALERLAAVLEAMEDGVLVIGGRGRVRLANARARALLGTPADPHGRSVVESVRHAGVLAALERAAGRGTPVVEEVTVNGGSRRRLRLHARAVRGGDPAGGIVAVFRDVTEARRVEAMRRDFVANASHELKTPLAAIRGFAERLAGARLPDPGAERAARTILSHAQRLAALVDDLLELSRLESEGGAGPVEALDVEAWVRRWLAGLEPRLAEARIEARVEAVGDPHARLDRAALERILTNLVDNAIRYTEPGGRVGVRVDGRDPGWLRLRVEDTGIGIPQVELPRIFERFYRVDPARSRASGGTGLGLAIVRHLVENAGGELSVTSRVGRGSAFTVALPRRAGAPDPEREEGPPAPDSAPEP